MSLLNLIASVVKVVSSVIIDIFPIPSYDTLLLKLLVEFLFDYVVVLENPCANEFFHISRHTSTRTYLRRRLYPSLYMLPTLHFSYFLFLLEERHCFR